MLAALSTPEPSTHDHRRFGLDKIVFGVTALIALAFVVWGFVGTATLSTSSTSVLTWVMTNTGWLFVLTASLFVVFVLWLAISRYGRIPL
ncbi:MAG: BCCT family transporter, partial [Nocardioidaceae bacterium]